jgi:hypothetical protein
MKSQNKRNSPLANQAVWKDSHTARFNLPVRHPALWRFLKDQLLSPAIRIHRLRHLSARMFEDSMSEIDGSHCR